MSPNNKYSIFSEFYDEMMQTVNYRKICSYLLKIFAKYSNVDLKCLLDLGCGTGNLALEFCKNGIDVIGCDESSDMLCAARNKENPGRGDLFLLNQPMDKLDLLHLADGAVSTLDTLNHVTDTATLKKVFERVSLFVRPGGLFVFDVNTVYKHSKILADNVFVYDLDSVYCVWKNNFEKINNTVDINLDFFVYRKNNIYEKYEERFKERAYTFSEIKKIITSCGFSLVNVFDAWSFAPPQKNSQRLVYVIKKGDINE